MSDNKDTIVEQLRLLGLSAPAATIYVELLKEPATHLQLSHSTGINRTKVYRLVDELEKRSLVAPRTDDRGTFLAAAEPEVLEAQLILREEELRQQRTALTQVVPLLQEIRRNDAKLFTVRTYRGVEGFQQMLWHELKAKGEVLIMGGAKAEELVPKRQWCERYRAATITAGYKIRELLNETHWDIPFSEIGAFGKIYTQKHIPGSVLLLDNHVAVYNDTVATYHWRQGEKVGVEIISKNYASMMRQIFEHYWRMAS